MVIDPNLISDLSNQLTDSKVLTPHSEGYAERLKRWSDCAIKQAGAVVLAGSAEDISRTVLFAQANSIKIAVCGGGHSAAGSSSIDGGIVIDLSPMRCVTVDSNNKTATAQGGALWLDVDVAAETHGLATVGGTVNNTGIGGLTLGGGHGWLTGKYGQVVDNLLSVKLVLADGSIATASEAENSELFWAVRGAGQNFGVVVEFVYQLYEQPNPVWAGVLAFSPDKIEAVVQFANHIEATTKGESAIEFGFSTPPSATEPAIVTAVFYDGVATDALRVFAPLLSLEPIMNTTTEMPYSMVNGMLNPLVAPGDRRALHAATFFAPLDATFVRSLFNDFVELTQKIPGSGESVILFEYIGRDKVRQVSPSAMAYANRGEYYNAVLAPKWSDSACDGELRASIKKMANRIQSEAGKGNPKDVGKYANYADFSSKHAQPSSSGAVLINYFVVIDVHVPIQDMFGQNSEKLRMLKTKYDPGNVFSKWHNLLQPTAVST
ncbi:fad binding domain protein [Lipomyces tetrasporus]